MGDYSLVICGHQEAPVQDTFMRWPEVKETTGLSRTTVWRLERAGGFPKRRQLGGNCVAWLESEVRGWMETRPFAERAVGHAAACAPVALSNSKPATKGARHV